MPRNGMPDDQRQMVEAHHSAFVNRCSKTEQPVGWRKFIFGRNQGATFGRRSPGRRALFSSVHPAPASWTASTGFTLIEVLLALAISAIVLVIVSSVFASALKLQERATANVDESLPVERALTVLRKDLKNSVAPGGMLAGPLQSGSDESAGVQIYTTTGLMTPNSPWSEIQKITYGLQPSADANASGKDLVRTVTRNLLSTGVEDEDDQFLASGVESLNFSYFDGANWLDSWDDTTETEFARDGRAGEPATGPKDSRRPARPEPDSIAGAADGAGAHESILDNTDDGSTNAPTGP